MFIYKLFFSILMTLLFSSKLFAHHPQCLNLQDHQTKINLVNYISIYEDQTRSSTLEEVLINSDNLFLPTSVTGNSFGFTNSIFWVKLCVHNHTTDTKNFILEHPFPLIDRITLYIPTNDGEYIEKSSGDAISFSKREIKHRNNAFRIVLEEDKNVTYYLRVESKGSVQIPLTLWEFESFIEEKDFETFVLGGYYGNLVLLMIFALVYYIKVRDTLFLSYAFYLFTYLYFQFSINGYAFQYVFFDLNTIGNVSSYVCTGLVVIGGAIFSGSFLQIWKQKTGVIKYLFFGLIVAGGVGIFLTLIGIWGVGLKISTVAGVALPVIVLIGAVVALRSGYKPARFFLLAWSVFLFGIFVAGLLYLGYLPHSFVTANAMQIGSAFEVLLLGYALIERLNLLKEEKQKAVIQANEYLTQMNQGLEEQVRKRTQELEEKNQELYKLSLLDSMTGLLNHRASFEYYKKLLSGAQRYNNGFSVVMCDIDHFKEINDTYGHQIGDEVIVAISNIIQENIRESDMAGRYGGEEFILFLNQTSVSDAEELAQRIRQKIRTLRPASINFNEITVSCGISEFQNFDPYRDLIKEADDALYQAKNDGRDRVVIIE